MVNILLALIVERPVMLCQVCNKPATVHLTEIIGGEKQERHLCEECAQKEGITIKTQVPIAKLLDNLVAAQEEAKHLSNLRCEQCNLTFSEFRKSGSLGCPNDYEAFREPLRELIERAHEGHTVHVGKVPKNMSSHTAHHSKLLKLRRNLREAIESEDYEAAANIRDRIRHISHN